MCLVYPKKTTTKVKVMHRKIVFVRVESKFIEITESVHWSRRCYAIIFISVWNEILFGSQGRVNQTLSCQHTLSKKTSAVHWRGKVVLEPVFYRGNRVCVLVLVCVFKSLNLIHTHPNSYQYFITAIKHLYICFIS